jgi:hypothetical protein
MIGKMSRKAAKVTQAIRHLQGGEYDPHFLGFFEAFNRQHFYLAHDILENLWLQDRRGPKGDFDKGLIQLAGAFVHVQKHRNGPALALLRLARANLAKYSPISDGLAIQHPMRVIEKWETFLSGNDGHIAQPDWPILNPA